MREVSALYQSAPWRLTSHMEKLLCTGTGTRMPLQIHLDQPVMRICGTLLGLGFVAVGLFSVLGSADLSDGVNQDRAMGFGLTAILIGLIAVLCSLLVKDLNDIWCRHPRRWK